MDRRGGTRHAQRLVVEAQVSSSTTTSMAYIAIVLFALWLTVQ